MNRSDRTASVHPLGWWLWGAALAATAARTTNLAVLSLVAAAALLVATTCRRSGDAMALIAMFARLAMFVIALRLVLQVLFAPRVPGTVLFRLPELGMPSWMAGLSIGGPVTAEALVAALADAGRLATLIVCFGALNALVSPHRLLRVLPDSLTEVGTATVIALSAAPRAAMTAAEIREARTLRGRPSGGLAGMRGIGLPLLSGTLERSIDLAAAMEVRGFGRTGAASPARRRVRDGVATVGVLATVAGTYGAMTGGLAGAGWWTGAGLLAVLVALRLGSRGTSRSRFEEQRWGWLSTAIVACGAAPLVATALVADRVLMPDTSLLAVPTVSPVLAATLAVAALPALFAPTRDGLR